MKIILCGFHWAGCRALDVLLDKENEVFVYTHDAPSHIPNLKALCEDLGVSYSTEKISESNLPFVPDIIVSVYYRFIIDVKTLESCKYKAINLHPSILPNYRGCSSLTWAMINNEKVVGFTYHYIDSGIDTGNIILQKEVPLYEWDTQESLYYRLMFEATNHLSDAIFLVSSGEVGCPQPAGGSYYKRGCPYNGEIKASWDDIQIKRFIRAMTFPPYAPATYHGSNVFSYADYLKIKENES